jgi:hypothetical protein
MNTSQCQNHAAIFAIVEIKAAIEEFDRGDANLFDVLDRIQAAVGAVIPARDSRPKAA